MIYNLLEEKWIPVLGIDGKPGRVGIMEALTKAGRIRQIATSNPMDRVATLRFLLALLYWCKGNPPDERSVTSADAFPENWFSKLGDNEGCFHLLGEGKRFYQYCKSGPDNDKKLSANYLVQEVPTGTNMWHFRHSTDTKHGLCPACCAMGLLRLPLFATSGGRGKPPGVNSKPPLYVIPVGVSLAETLLLSWQRSSDVGTPAWEQPDMQLPKTGKVSLLMGLTWLPRRVWLDNPEEPEAACISCGCKENLIRLSVFAPIGSTRPDEDGQYRIWRDPHVLYTTSGKGEVISLHAGNALGTPNAAAGQWARIMAGMLWDNPLWQAIHNSVNEDAKIHAWVVGFSTVQNDKYLEAIEYVIPFPWASHESQERLEKFERWQKEGSSLVRKVRPPKEKASSGRKHVEIPPAIFAIRPHVENKVYAKVGELITGADAAWNRAAEEYRPMVAMMARSLSPGFTVSAVRRRQQIAHARLGMRPRTEADKKPGHKKGGNK